MPIGYEAMYDACLHDLGIAHEHEVRVRGTPFIADFRVDGVLVEVVGMLDYAQYRVRHRRNRVVYETLGVEVRWLKREEVARLFASCSLPLTFRTNRRCEDCGLETADLVKNVCRRCYMHRWHSRGTSRACAECGGLFLDRKGQRFCSRQCYWQTLELDWPSWDEMERRLAEKPAARVAADLQVKPSTLSMRLRRRGALADDTRPSGRLTREEEKWHESCRCSNGSVPQKGWKHLLKRRDLELFVELVPNWDELADGLESIVLARDGDEYMGYHLPGRVAIAAWEADLWWEDMNKEWYWDHERILERLDVEVWKEGPRWVAAWTEDQARAFQLLHVFTHELGHHHDRMTTRTRRRAARGEDYAEQFAYELEQRVWDDFVRVFPL